MPLKLNREELKSEFKELIDLIQKNHVMEPIIEKELFENHVPVKHLCHTRGYFVIFDGFYMQYSMAHVIMDVDLKLIGRAVEEVIFYDSYPEYEFARVKAMSEAKQQTGLNYN